jgi:hypothetical protein
MEKHGVMFFSWNDIRSDDIYVGLHVESLDDSLQIRLTSYKWQTTINNKQKWSLFIHCQFVYWLSPFIIIIGLIKINNEKCEKREFFQFIFTLFSIINMIIQKRGLNKEFHWSKLYSLSFLIASRASFIIPC